MILLLLACNDTSDKRRPDDTNSTIGCASGEVLDGETCVPEACGTGNWGNLPVDDDTVYVAPGGTGDGSEGNALGSIQEAMNASGERKGGLVAVAAGTYFETIAVDKEHDGITLAGRCRELVTINGSEGAEVPAIEIDGGDTRLDMRIEGVTITGGTYGGLKIQRASVTMTSTDVADNTTFGIIVGDAELTLDRVGIRNTGPDEKGRFGRALNAQDGATLIATECTVERNAEFGVLASGSGTNVHLESTDVLDTSADADGAYGWGIGVWDGTTLSITGGTVQRNTAFGVLAIGSGTAVELTDVRVLDTIPSPDGAYGRGVGADDGALLIATRTVVQRNTDVGMVVEGRGTRAEIVDTAVLDTASGPGGLSGRGIHVQSGASLTATDCTIQGNSEVGVSASDTSTTVELVNTSVLDTSPLSDGTYGWGVGMESGAALSAVNCTVGGNTDLGVLVTGSGTTATLVGTSVLDTAPSAAGTQGWGISGEAGAVLTATECTVQRNTDIGVVATGPGTTVNLAGTSILDTAPSPAGPGGRGILARDSAFVSASDTTIQRNTDSGVLVGGIGVVVNLIDTVVSDTAPSPDGTGGQGIIVMEGASLTATGCTVQQNTDIGVFALHSGTTVTLIDTEVLDTAPLPDGTFGMAIAVQEGAFLSALECTAERNTDVAVYASGSGTVVELVDTSVLDTAPSPDGTGGRGIGVQFGASLTAVGCMVSGNTQVGVFAGGEGAVVDLLETTVSRTHRGRATGFATGVTAQTDATLRASACDISDNEGPGAYANDDGTIELQACTLLSNTFAGALVVGGSAFLDDAAVADTSPDAEWGGGIGVYANDLGGAGTLSLTNSTIGPHPYAAVWLDGDGAYVIEDNDLSGNEPYDLRGVPIHGNAVFAERGTTAWNGASGLRIARNHLHGSSDVAVLLDGSTAELEDNTWDDNGTDVWQQRCDDTTQLVDPDPDWVVCTGGNLLTDLSLQFTALYLPDADPL